jgi:hypothetical protein
VKDLLWFAMISNDLLAEGFQFWGKFNGLSRSTLLSRVPKKFGVYILRKTTVVRRVRGESDIIYIGSACNQNGLQGRLRQYFSPGPTQRTNKRILALVTDSEEYEIGWCELAAKSDAVGLEQRLLERYFENHGERPPQNLKG